jgi:hypothetical protein
VLLTEMRAAVVDTSAPHAWDLVGAAPLLAAGALVVIAVVLGLYVFNRQAPRIAEEL